MHSRPLEVLAQLQRQAVEMTRQSARQHAWPDIALGSASELRYLLQLAEELGMLEGADLGDCRTRSAHVVRALYRLQESVGALADDRSQSSRDPSSGMSED